MPLNGFDLDCARLAATFCVCAALCFCAFEVAAAKASVDGKPCACAGALIGLAVWADPLLAGWPARFDGSALLVALPLVAAVGLSIWALYAFQRGEGLLGVIAGGAILGGAMAFSHFAVLLAIHAPIDAFNDLFTAGVGISTALAVLALLIWHVWRHPAAGPSAAVLVALGATASRTLARVAAGVQVTPVGAAACAAPIAAVIVLAALWAFYRFELRKPYALSAA